jgi:cyanophycin synthetase
MREGRRALGLDDTVYVDARVEEYRRYWEAAARSLGADMSALADGIWEVRYRSVRTRIAGYVLSLDDPVTLRIAGNKALCYRLARDAGVPVAEHRVVRLANVAAARSLLLERPGLYVVKPARGSSSGIGVTTCVSTPEELEAAAVLASLFCDELLVERMVPGESYRLLFLDGEFLHAVRRRGTRVVGDGRSTVAELLRRQPDAGRLDALAEMTLGAQGLGPASVPAAGRSVLVRGLPPGTSRSRELRTIYDEPATELLHPEVVAAAGRVVQALGSQFAGVDVVTADPAVPLDRSGGVFLEINTTPGIHHHCLEAEGGQTSAVATRVLQFLLGIPAPAGG